MRSDASPQREKRRKAYEMRRKFRYGVVLGPNETYAAYLTERLRLFNVSQSAGVADDPGPERLEIYALDEAGNVVAGLIGKTVWGWLEIAVLWVDAGLRHMGTGRELMYRAEDEARRRGCNHARLSTFDFQAPRFYERLGYVVYGRLDDYPAGNTVYYFRKDLGSNPPDQVRPVR